MIGTVQSVKPQEHHFLSKHDMFTSRIDAQIGVLVSLYRIEIQKGSSVCFYFVCLAHVTGGIYNPLNLINKHK